MFRKINFSMKLNSGGKAKSSVKPTNGTSFECASTANDHTETRGVEFIKYQTKNRNKDDLKATNTSTTLPKFRRLDLISDFLSDTCTLN